MRLSFMPLIVIYYKSGLKYLCVIVAQLMIFIVYKTSGDDDLIEEIPLVPVLFGAIASGKDRGPWIIEGGDR